MRPRNSRPTMSMSESLNVALHNDGPCFLVQGERIVNVRQNVIDDLQPVSHPLLS